MGKLEWIYLEGAIWGDGLAGLLRRQIDSNNRSLGKFCSHFNSPNARGTAQIKDLGRIANLNIREI